VFKRRSVASLALALLTPLLSGCSSDQPPGESGAPGGVPSAEKQIETELEGELRRRWQRPELRSYLMLTNSFIGGTMPRTIAGLLRETRELVSKHVSHLETSGSTDQNLLQAHKALETFAKQTAELYELMAAQPLNAVRDMREGLVIDDPGVHAEYNRRVDDVNASIDRLDNAIKALTPEQKMSFRRMAVATVLEAKPRGK